MIQASILDALQGVLDIFIGIIDAIINNVVSFFTTLFQKFFILTEYTSVTIAGVTFNLLLLFLIIFLAITIIISVKKIITRGDIEDDTSFNS